MDVVFDQLACNSSLPLSIVGSTFKLTCNGRRRCSVLGDYALAEGQLVLNGVQDSGIENGEIYFSGYIDTESSAFFIRKVMDLCNHTIKENLYSDGDDAYQNGDEGNNGDHANNGDDNNNYQCQLEDGTYYFSTEFSIPQIDSNWGDTGWTSNGQLIMYTYEGKQVGSCQASFRTLSEFGPSSKTVFLVLMPLVGVAFFVLTYFVLRRVISNNPDLCGDDLTCKSEGVTTSAYSIFSDSTSFSSDSSISMKCRESKLIRNNPDWCVDDLTYNSEGVTTSTYSVLTDSATKSERVTTTTYSIFSHSATVFPDSNTSMKCRGSKPISKEGCEKGKTIGGVGDKRDRKVEEIKRVRFGVEDKKVEENKRVRFGVEDKRGKKVEKLKRVKIDPPDGIEEAMLRTQKKHIGKEAQISKSPSHRVRMRVSAVNKVLRRPSVQEKCASDDDAQAYSRTEDGNIKSVAVSASSPPDKSTGYLRMEMAKTKSAVVSTSSASDETKVQQHIEEAVTKSASSTAKEIKAYHLVEEANTKSTVVSASSSAHERKGNPLRKTCTEAPVVSASSAAHETKANHLADEIDTKSAVVFVSSAAPDIKDYQRLSKDNVKAVFTQNEQAVVTRKNEKIQRMSADLAAVGGDIAAMGGDMVSSFAAAFFELTTSQDTEHNDPTHVRNSDRRHASLAPSPKNGKRMIRDDNSSEHAVALGRPGLTRCHDMSVIYAISASATDSVATSVAVDWRKKNDKAESSV